MKSEYIDDIIINIEKNIENKVFVDYEKSKVEFKDLSTGSNWTSLKETICAFLNTEGGFAFCGIRERDKQYTITGFDRKNESNIIELQNNCFRDDNGLFLDLSSNIHFDYYKIKEKDIVVIAVHPISDDTKYISFNGKYYERKLTQDKEIPHAKLQRHREYKLELEYAKELTPIQGAQINDLSLDKINKYITLLNLEIRNETLKPSIAKAKDFLAKQHFTKETQIKLLGLLICGEDPFHFLNARAEVNCYYDTSSDIGKDKKIFRNDVISLMEETFKYIWGHIKINRTIREGGKSEPEYPEKLIRETINNALAHRDYTIDSFITVTVEPNCFIEIKNPGSFKEKMKLVITDNEVPIRRLIPGIPESKNPRLASVLKVFDKIESQGRGMASLINACLHNEVDVPYYEIKDGMVILKIPSGKLVDESFDAIINGFENYIINKLNDRLNDEHKAVLAYFYKSELLNKQRFFTILLSESNNHFAVIDQLKNAGLIYEHKNSDIDNPIFILDRVLTKTTFTDELIVILGKEFINFDRVAKEILNITYLQTKYNKKAQKASEMTPEVYRRIYGQTNDPKKYETLGRKVRKICIALDSETFLTKDINNRYTFNFDTKPQNKLVQ